MAKGSDNPFPSVLLVEGSAPASPSAGNQRVFIDSADHLIKVVNSSGTVVPVGSKEASFTATGLTGATAASRYVGATASGAPVSGTFAVGDFIIDQTGKVYICTTAGTPGTWTQVGGGGGSGLYTAYLRYQEEQAQNTSGGTFTSGAWQTRVLNQEKDDTGNHGTLASNQVTLDAGTYRALAHCPAFQVERHQARIQNITDSATLLLGQSSYAVSSSAGAAPAVVAGRFTIAGSKVIEVQHRCATTATTRGFGVEANLSTEIYTILELWKE